MVYWAPILHFYQPPTQFPAVLKRICDESYRPLLNAMKAVTLSKVDERCQRAAEDRYEVAESVSRRVHDLLLAK